MYIKSLCILGVVTYQQIIVSSPYFKNLKTWQECGAEITTDNGKVVEEASVIFLSVKPHILTEALGSIKIVNNKMDNKLFISILAGSTLKKLEKVFTLC